MLLFVAMAATAIGRACRLGTLQASVLTLPTLALAVPPCQDAGMIAMMALAIAQLNRFADDQQHARPAELVVMAEALAGVAMARPLHCSAIIYCKRRTRTA